MNKRVSRFFCAAVILTTCLATVSCHKDPVVNPDDDPDADTLVVDVDAPAKDFLRSQYMNIYYYWQSEVIGRNAVLDPSKYDIYDYFDAMLYEKDRWSWMCDRQYYVDSESGIVIGTYGASLGQPIEYYDDYGVYVRYVYPDSPFAKNGVTRGCLLTHIDGVEVMDLIIAGVFDLKMNTSPHAFTFTDPSGKIFTFTTEWATSLNVKSSLDVKLFTESDFPGLQEPVGYFNYLSFKANFLDDIINAMEILKAASVKTLILDLRYNGGGDSRASQMLVNYLAPADKNGQIYVKRVHNKLLSSADDICKVGAVVTDPVSGDKLTGSSIGIEHLYIITGSGMASASEMVANGLRPMMDVKMVGDTTYGKPNGMYVLMYPGSDADYTKYDKGDFSKLEWVFLPICFYNNNGVGESIPDSGFVPDCYRPDDLYHDFNANELSIKACLTHIVTGSFPQMPEKKSVATRAAGKRVKLCISEEEKDPHYGLYLVDKHAEER